MGSVRHEVLVKASRAKAFAYIDDYHNVPDWMFGVQSFTPVTEKKQGLGSEFETVVKIGPKKLESTVRCVEHVQDELIYMQAIKGFGASTRWEFADTDEPGIIQVTAVFDFTLPGGVAGRVLSGLLEPAVAQGVKHVEGVLRKNIEEA